MRTCAEPREKSCSVDMTVKCTGPKSKLYQGESANGSLAAPGMGNLAGGGKGRKYRETFSMHAVPERSRLKGFVSTQTTKIENAGIETTPR